MTTVEPPDERRDDPRPGGADNTLAEPAPQQAGRDGDSAGSPPAAAAQPPRQSDADEGNGARESFASIVAETLGLAPGYLMIKPSVTRENDSTAEYDADKAPFTVSVRPEEDEPETWAVVLDRALTPEEKQKLVAVENDRAGAFSYLKKLGGRPLATTATLENAPKRYKDQLASPALGGYVDVFQMNVMSTRSTSVAINRWQVTDVTCQKSVPWGKSCQWGIKVRYTDPYQTERWVQLKDSNGKPLRIRTDSIPTDARETWGLIVQPWRLCDRSGKCIVHATA
ncbi:hypothetical protein ACF09I_31225 [Streptomyces sp. NPDC014940]|uniref:hypothetical protein n=1 Tax=Streptomyces sp. NPDC014940 TaxID=3364932 RepID=UPI0037034886